jgi:nucleoside-diphosphate-sugar epimerase/putative sterol carrier protein
VDRGSRSRYLAGVERTAVAVTGAAGSLGNVLLARLRASPAVGRIVAIDRRVPGSAPAGVDVRTADVRDPAIGEHFAGCGAVVHLAFIVERGSRDPDLVESVNVGGSRNVFEAAAGRGVARVVYASSIAAYGAHPENLAGPLGEDAPIRGNAEFYYSRTKAEVERWLDGFEERHPGIAVARMRPSIFLGPRGNRGVDRFRGRIFPYLRGRSNPVHVTHEEDVADAFVLALERGARGAFNVAADSPVPVREWPREMGKLGLPVPDAAIALFEASYRAGRGDLDPAWFRFGSEYPILVSSDRIRRELAWTPRWETTGDVLRALAGTPTVAASRQVKLLLGTMAAVTRWRGDLPVGGGDRERLRGIEGSLNLLLTGERRSAWHFWFRGGRTGAGGGLDPDGRATVVMDESDFLRLLAGDLDYTVATMTGVVRLRGDGGFGLIAGAVFSQLRLATRDDPQAPWPRRAFSWAYRAAG